MNITLRTNNRLRSGATACALAGLAALPVSAEQPYVQWVKKPFGLSSIEFFGDPDVAHVMSVQQEDEFQNVRREVRGF